MFRKTAKMIAITHEASRRSRAGLVRPSPEVIIVFALFVGMVSIGINLDATVDSLFLGGYGPAPLRCRMPILNGRPPFALADSHLDIGIECPQLTGNRPRHIE
ncbi:hypothetical protein [Burkholderia cenocepacia]|uniref:hypothetical protein n=1 Tax=Burkholderia cenocepacia TaxID=95486 RepID=UPI001CF27DE0|nr:hypothetical protein [Burkholderia cenocepacia]MCA8234573.1 hypothetical protein [Burkholderia cenocepacia]